MEGSAQIIFIDTPGIFQPKRRLGGKLWTGVYTPSDWAATATGTKDPRLARSRKQQLLHRFSYAGPRR